MVVVGVEFLDILEKVFRKGKFFNMVDFEVLYIDVLRKK